MNNNIGVVTVADLVTAKIAYNVAEGIHGVAKVSSSVIKQVASVLSGQKAKTLGVTVVNNETEGLQINISICVKYGFNMKDVAQKLQHEVALRVENLTGLKVSGVNITVDSLDMSSKEVASHVPKLR